MATVYKYHDGIHSEFTWTFSTSETDVHRFDLKHIAEYSLSTVTHTILAGVDVTIYISNYFIYLFKI